MLVAAPGGFAPVQAPPPPVLANGCSPAQNSPRVLPASACVLWPTWRVPSSHLPRGGGRGCCSHGLPGAWPLNPGCPCSAGAQHPRDALAGLSRAAGASCQPLTFRHRGRKPGAWWKDLKVHWGTRLAGGSSWLEGGFSRGTSPRPSCVESAPFIACVLSLYQGVLLAFVLLLSWLPPG